MHEIRCHGCTVMSVAKWCPAGNYVYSVPVKTKVGEGGIFRFSVHIFVLSQTLALFTGFAKSLSLRILSEQGLYGQQNNNLSY